MYEVEQVLVSRPKFRFVEKGEREGEAVYLALGQTDAGRYLAVLFIYKQTREALILSARDMAPKERRMRRNEVKSIPRLSSLDELVEFFETHDLGDYWEQMPETDFEVDIKRRTHVFALEEDLVERLTAVAREKQVPSEMLVNVWIREKLSGESRT